MRSARWASPLVTALVAVLVLPGSAARAADPRCSTPPQVTAPIADVPWAQRSYDLESAAWPFGRGAGVTVAVLDTGVDATHPQLAGQVLPGVDVAGGTASGDYDCATHGTALASIVAARQVPGTGFHGVAPDARVLPVRVAAQPQTAPVPDLSRGVAPAALAAGLDAAVAAGAQVAVVGVVVHSDDPVLAGSVQRAQAAGVVVVAAVGDGHDEERDRRGPTNPALTPYPAAYDGVVGVAAVDAAGERVTGSQVGSYVDLAAPGGAVIADGVVGQLVLDGTGPAAAFVAGTAALLLSATPSPITATTPAERAQQVAARLVATASPAGTGPFASGAGLLDPARALTEATTAAPPSAVAGPTPPPTDPAAEALADQRAGTRRTAMVMAMALMGLVVVVLVAAWAVPRAARRRWRAGQERAAVPERGDDGAEFLPGDLLFRPSTPPR